MLSTLLNPPRDEESANSQRGLRGLVLQQREEEARHPFTHAPSLASFPHSVYPMNVNTTKNKMRLQTT